MAAADRYSERGRSGAGRDINWRSGSLSRFESLSSVGAKFCQLNRVRPRSFRRFVEGFLSSRVEGYASRFSPLDSSHFDLTGFAKAIGEPVRLVRSMAWEPWLPTELLIPGVEALNGFCLNRTLRYCPQCMQKGYHAVFHQFPWFSRCLVHGAMLQSFHRSTASPEYFQTGGRGVFLGDGYLVDECMELFFGNDRLWEGANDPWWSAELDSRLKRRGSAFLKWMQTLLEKARVGDGLVILKLSTERLNWRESMAALASCVKPPEFIAHCLEVGPVPRLVVRHTVTGPHVQPVFEWCRDVVDYEDFADLLRYRIGASFLSDIFPDWRVKLDGIKSCWLSKDVLDGDGQGSVSNEDAVLVRMWEKPLRDSRITMLHPARELLMAWTPQFLREDFPRHVYSALKERYIRCGEKYGHLE